MSEPLSIIGSVLASAAAGWAQAQMKKDEWAREDELQKRRTESLRGLGKSVRYWENQEDDASQPLSKKIASAPPVGSTENMIGQRYIERAERNRTQGPRYTFDQRTGRLRYG